jgi:hypothetical protein
VFKALIKAIGRAFVWRENFDDFIAIGFDQSATAIRTTRVNNDVFKVASRLA